jgi:tetratricopeptide (TPR) repeat protein
MNKANIVNIGKITKKLISYYMVFFCILAFPTCSREPAEKISESNNEKAKDSVEIPIDSKADIYKLILEENIDFSPIVKKADSLFNIGEYVEAEFLYAKAHNLSLKSGNKKLMSVTLIGTGASKDRQSKYEEAIVVLNKALINKNSMDSFALSSLHFNLGVSYHKLNKIEQAIGNYTNAIKVNSKNAEAYYNRGYIYSEKDYNKAIEDFTKAVGYLPEKDDLYGYRGDCYQYKEDYEKAIKDYTKANELNPKGYKYIYNRGFANYYIGNYNEAISDFTEAIRLKSDEPDAYSLRGLIFISKEMYDEAISDFTKAINLKSDESYFFYYRGFVFMKQKMYDEAISDFTKAIRLKPDEPDFFFDRGNVFVKDKMYYEAISDFTKVIELDPLSYQAYANRATIYKEIKEFDKAIKGFNKAIELAPNDTLSYYYRGITFAKKGELEKAIKDLEKAIKINPDYTKAKIKLKEINALTEDLNKQRKK